jgi:tripartite-type tricarboxylate transporter receptor subunit TctC
LCARKDFPGSTLDEFIAAAKARPKGVSNGTPGSGSVSDILARYAFKHFGIVSEGIHYRGEVLALPDLLSGRTDTQFVSVAVAAQQLQRGAVRVLATTGAKRAAVLASIPTFGELGYPDIMGDSWQIVMAPAGTPAPVVTRLSAAIADVTRSPAFAEKLAKLGVEAVSAPPAEIARLLKEEHRRWGAVVAENKITQE